MASTIGVSAPQTAGETAEEVLDAARVWIRSAATVGLLLHFRPYAVRLNADTVAADHIFHIGSGAPPVALGGDPRGTLVRHAEDFDITEVILIELDRESLVGTAALATGATATPPATASAAAANSAPTRVHPFFIPYIASAFPSYADLPAGICGKRHELRPSQSKKKIRQNGALATRCCKRVCTFATCETVNSRSQPAPHP